MQDNFAATLRILCKNEIRFVLVGGLAAILNGAPVHTFDIDLVYSRDSENIDRLLAFLQSIGAVFRIQPERRLRPTRSHLERGGHLNLLTCNGPVDLLGTIGQGLGYEELIPHSNEMDLGEGLRLRVLNLEMLISLKEQLASDKDVAMLPLLRRTLIETAKKKL